MAAVNFNTGLNNTEAPKTESFGFNEHFMTN